MRVNDHHHRERRTAESGRDEVAQLLNKLLVEFPAQDYRTPYEKLVRLPKWQQCRMSDTEAAQRRRKIKRALLGKSRGGK